MVRMRTNYTLAGATVVTLGPAPRGYTYLLQLFVDDAQQVVELSTLLWDGGCGFDCWQLHNLLSMPPPITIIFD